jgi:hypothetical protein
MSIYRDIPADVLSRTAQRAFVQQRALQSAGVSQWGDSRESVLLRSLIWEVDSIDSELLRRRRAAVEVQS